jgi:stearoyl-CoA desaturase (Delta-9 desaturase)
MSALHRRLNLIGVVLPFVGFVAAIVLLWNTLVDWSDLAVLLIMYVISGYGVTLGFHRLLTHRSFQTFKPVEYTLAIVGSFSLQGP